MGLVKLNAGVGGVGRTLCRRELDWSNFLQDGGELVKLSMGAEGIAETFCGSGWDW